MAATIADLGARVLRRLGVAVVAVADRPAAGAVVSITDIAARALRDVGINPIAAADLPAYATTTTVTEIAARALRALGVNPVAADSQAVADSTPVSQSEIATRALERLGVVTADETPAALDLAAAIEKVTAAHEALNAFGLVTWALDAIPNRAAEHYVVMTTQWLAPTFGKPADMALYAQAQEVLRLQALSGPAGQTLAEAKVAAAHDALAAQGLVTWTSAAIPQAHAEDYAAMTAALMAPVFGKTADGAVVAAIEARIRRAALSGARGQASAEAKVSAAHEALNAQGLVSWASSAIPLAHAEEYVALTANLLAPMVGKPVADVSGAEARIRRASLLRNAPTIAEQAVLDVHANLDARGKARWTVWDIPDYAENPYILLAANLVAPTFGLPQDPGAEVRAMRELAQVIALGSGGGHVRAEYF